LCDLGDREQELITDQIIGTMTDFVIVPEHALQTERHVTTMIQQPKTTHMTDNAIAPEH